jgi:hypothetical protein
MPSQPAFSLTIADCLREILVRLSAGLRTTNAALACAEAGAEEEAVRLVLDLETQTYEADKLLFAVTLLNRLRRERAGSG